VAEWTDQLEGQQAHSVGEIRPGHAYGVANQRNGELMQSMMSRRAFVTGLAMLSIPLVTLAQDKDKDKAKEDKKKKAEEKKDEAKDKAEDAVDDKDKAVDGPGTDRSQDRRQDRRREEVKKSN
jgi:hypothetical protein